MQQLKLTLERETIALNKQVHELIKLKKKKASYVAQDKNELQRYSLFILIFHTKKIEIVYRLNW
jgi:hypothetical protein